MTHSFEPGQLVYVKRGTFHNPEKPGQPEALRAAKFVRYMAGGQYAVLLVWNQDGPYNIRVDVEDLDYSYVHKPSSGREE